MFGLRQLVKQDKKINLVNATMQALVRTTTTKIREEQKPLVNY
jgi:hypothetical protein